MDSKQEVMPLSRFCHVMNTGDAPESGKSIVVYT